MITPITRHVGTGMPLRRDDVDTDQIAPARFVPYFRPFGYTNILFADWRDDPSFVLNLPQYQGATVLIAGKDFGTGSSRESAVWAIQHAGFKAVIAERFGDIFAGNALTKGLLTVTVAASVISELWQAVEADPWLPITVDVADAQLRYSGRTVDYDLDDAARHRLMNGADPIAATLEHEEEIRRFEANRRRQLDSAGSSDSEQGAFA
jgi:3-isopropylmalate/(R)-2-methylmalate dehydratase small subunit